MARPITLASGQFGDLDLESLCALAKKMGFEGLELATHAHFDVAKAVSEPGYVESVKETLAKYDLGCWALSAHLTGQCVGDNWDPRLDGFAPAQLSGQPEKIREWAIQEMKDTAKAARMMDIDVVPGFTGSPLWAWWYSYPQTTAQMISDGYKKIFDLWTPIFDVFDEYNVKFALEIHATEIAFDYYTTERLLETFDYRPTLGINYDPSHLVWQGVNEVVFLHDFIDRVYHVHMKDIKMHKNDKAGILGSHLDFGDLRRKWNFVSVGRGDVNFDGIIRELNAANYEGPLSVEWEDSGMDREFGTMDSYKYVKEINYKASDIAMDAMLKKS